jgi:hypothetical protein
MGAQVETTEYAAMMRRMVRAYGRRIVDADVEDLAELVQLRAMLDDVIADAVASSRETWGRSWADIARPLGITRQGAEQRYQRRVAERRGQPTVDSPVTTVTSTDGVWTTTSVELAAD